MVMDIGSEVKDLLEDKIDEVFLAMQEKYNITSGDVDPWVAYKIDELVNEISLEIAATIEYEKGDWIGDDEVKEACENGKCNECKKHAPEIVGKKEIK